MITQNLASTNFNALINTLSIQGYVIFDDFLAANIIIALRDEVDKRHINNEMVAAKTGLLSQLNPSKIRGDQICWLDEDSANINIQAYFAEMQALKMQLNQQLFMNLHSLETHLAIYPIGSIYQKHLDQFSQSADVNQTIGVKNDTKARQLSSILYLNADWQTDEGGELRLHLNALEYLDILPTAGKLVLFLSEKFWHEVRPATRERASLTGWFRTRSQSLI
ncbi:MULTISPECIES: 2OG-Fe(II) oxygenase [Methylotenera]|uniref:2OG-Fe(II) oxygenase n=1 Tax=Methylotenera TaxID=359407 RepID=UPI000374B565|nr:MULTISPECIES: 2OG-Fe(II) oxygenase [Methylotenera]